MKKNDNLKRLIWTYFFLLIFEGAIRRWLLPGLSNLIIIIRDPVAIGALVLGISEGRLKYSPYVLIYIFIGILGGLIAIVAGHGNAFIALYGARIFLIHFPMIFLIANVFSRKDVLALGKYLLAIVPLMTLVMALQFYSPQSSWINRGMGDVLESAGFSGAMGFFRPPGLFSFINGLAQYYALCGAFALYFWLNLSYINKYFLMLCTICVLVAIPLSLSRTLLFSLLISVIFVVAPMLRQPKKALIVLGTFGFLGIFFSFAIMGNLGDAGAAFSTRFENASESEGGLKGTLVDRFLGGMVFALSNTNNQPFFGVGMGLGTNAGAKLALGDARFQVSEEEWGRNIGELGPLLGLLAIGVRVALASKMITGSFVKMMYEDSLAWILCSFSLLSVAQGQWGQPTSLGFAVVSGGATLALLKKRGPVKIRPPSIPV